MEKKLYISPVVELETMVEETLMAGSLNLNGDSGTGTLNNTEVDAEGLNRDLDFKFFD
ncbi:MAG: hypothetical protein IJ533_10510 [Prevotella sp.]|nr:hypothetical protein [Prevotella sp.]MBQ8488064.1 hypothetical protein [Prevotella sp.]